MISVPSKVSKMKIQLRVKEKNALTQLEKILIEANKNHVTSCNKEDLHETRIIVEQIVRKFVTAMKKHSTSFCKLYVKNLGVGSVYEKTKIGEPNEFDIDIVLKFPEVLKPTLKQEVAGFVQVQLENFKELEEADEEMHKTLAKFIDSENYLLSQKMVLSYVHRTLTEASVNYFPNGIVRIGDKEYSISKIEYIDPALTVTIEGSNFFVTVDLVTSFMLGEDLWPEKNYRKNPCSSLNNFFLTPATPLEDQNHKERFWRLSFHMQERQIISNRLWMKPAIRALKRVRDYFNQKVHSYAIKTMFLWELHGENPDLSSDTPVLWKSSLSFIVVHMLEKYLKFLTQESVPHFWDARLNLLSYLSEQEMKQYTKEITEVLSAIKKNPQEVSKYFK